MFKLICVSAIFLLHVSTIQAYALKHESSEGEGDHSLVCEQNPIELGIVLDSSSSIHARDFSKAIKFLQDFVGQYEIGDGHDDVRVSIITFGKGIYQQHAFGLTTYNNKDDVVKAIGKVPHKFGLYTSTGEAIEYMSRTQLSADVSRPWADRVSVVITDGNSQKWRRTKEAAQAARDSGIKMFAIGVGNVRQQELLNIAGDESRVVKVDNFDQLQAIKTGLAYRTCIMKEKTTTTPRPQTEKCGVENPADVYFVFSPAELGMAATSWTTSFISTTIKQAEMDDGFRFGVVSGSCPDDEGFDLDDYTTVDEIDHRLTNYLKPRMPSLVERLSISGYSVSSGGRDEARDVAVLVANGGKKNKGLEAEVQRLLEAGVQNVFIADPHGSGIDIEGATTLAGRNAKDASANLVTHLCPVRTGEA